MYNINALGGKKMKTKTKVIIGSIAGVGVLTTAGKIVRVRKCHKMLDRYNLDHNNAPLIPKKKVRLRVFKGKNNA
jgi:hypothetical protein